MDTFDYIIVGAGSAGCILANRLSADPANRVLLLEAGPPDWLPWIHIPAGFIKTFYHPRVNWLYSMEPSEWTGGRSIHAPRGKTFLSEGVSSVAISEFGWFVFEVEDFAAFPQDQPVCLLFGRFDGRHFGDVRNAVPEDIDLVDQFATGPLAAIVDSTVDDALDLERRGIRISAGRKRLVGRP